MIVFSTWYSNDSFNQRKMAKADSYLCFLPSAKQEIDILFFLLFNKAM